MEDIKILGLDVHGPLFSVSHTDIRDQLDAFIKEIGKEDVRADFEHYLQYCRWSDKRYDDMRKKIYSAEPVYNEKSELQDTLINEMAYVEIMLHQYLVYTWTFIYNTLNKEEFAKLKQKHIEETIKRKVDEAIPVLQELKERGVERIIAVTSIPYTGECLKAADFFGPIDKCCTSAVHETGAPMPALFKKIRKIPEDSALYRNWKVVDIGLPTEENKEYRLFYTTPTYVARFKKMDIFVPFLRGKTECLKLYAHYRKTNLNQIAFVGDGYSDLHALQSVKYPIVLSRGQRRTKGAAQIEQWAEARNIPVVRNWPEILELPIFRKS